MRKNQYGQPVHSCPYAIRKGYEMSKYMLISTDDVTREIEAEVFDTLLEAREHLLEEFKDAIGEDAWNELLEDIGGESELFTKELSYDSDFGVAPMSAWANHSRLVNHADVDWKIVAIENDAQTEKTVSIAVEVVGGMVQNVYADGPVSVDVYDFDSDDAEEIERLETARKELHAIATSPDWYRAY